MATTRGQRIGSSIGRFLSSGPGLILLFVLLCGFYATLSFIRLRPPAVVDEFSHLLIGDTLAQGRFTNPTHPLHDFFECVHVMMQPTYTGKYAVGLPILMAIGQKLFGMPVFGSWVSVAGGAVAVFWALENRLTLRWRLLALMLVAFHPSVINWSQIYMGCGLAIWGGALVMGAIFRFLPLLDGHATISPESRKRAEFRYGLLFGCGVAILAVSRPFEGILLTLFGLAFLILPYIKVLFTRFSVARIAGGAILPILILLAFQLPYNKAVTGSLFTLPYMEYTKRYDPVPIFLWQHPKPAMTYVNHRMTEHYQSDLNAWNQNTQNKLLPAIKWAYGKERFFESTKFITLRPFLRILCFLATAGIVLIWGRRKTSRRTVLALIFFILAAHVDNYIANRYTAPGIILMTLAFIVGLRAILVRGLFRVTPKRLRPLSYHVWYVLLVGIVLLQLGIYLKDNYFRYRPEDVPQGSVTRKVDIEKRLAAAPRNQLVLIRYLPAYDMDEEWGYNLADIDRQKVIWAHDLGTERNQELLKYYPDREVSLLSLGKGTEPVRLEPYTGN